MAFFVKNFRIIIFRLNSLKSLDYLLFVKKWKFWNFSKSRLDIEELGRGLADRASVHRGRSRIQRTYLELLSFFEHNISCSSFLLFEFFHFLFSFRQHCICLFCNFSCIQHSFSHFRKVFKLMLIEWPIRAGPEISQSEGSINFKTRLHQFVARFHVLNFEIERA